MSDTNSIVASLETDGNKEAIDGLEAIFATENDFFSGLETEESTVEETSTETVAAVVEEAVEEVVEETVAEGDPDQGAALQLFKALKDPNLSPYILDYLNKGKHPTNAADEAFNPLVEIRKAFPEGYENIADQLAPALVKVVDKMVEDRTKPIQEDADKRIFADNVKTVTITYNEFAKSELGLDKIPDNYEKELSTLVKQFPYNGEGKLQDYTKNLLYMAKGKLGVPKATTTVDKSTETAPVQKQKSPLSKLAAAPKPSGVQSSGTSKPTKLNLTDAFDAALRSLTK